ncbi:oligopeptide ABC transporter permease [Caldalkalibacillus salinus]|uniref:oligopeptide ABC transporter permease n=1 Tax=Caldalkalibacillus salinus TaxID=2803787 RepID=UPI001920E0BC|nr:oligopeptide ABC transporter permease [Caldalkalibacillus salinus]
MELEKQPTTESAVEANQQKNSLGPWALAYRRFKKNKLAVAGVFMLAFILFIAVFADVIDQGTDPTESDLYNIEAPMEGFGGEHILGTDSSGRDVFARLVHGSRVSLTIGYFAMFFTVLIGIVLGSLSGYYGGKVDGLIMRFTDIMLNFPFLLFVLTVVAILQDINIMIFVAVIALTAWPAITRIIRGTYLQLREQEFILSARAIGCSDARMIFRHLLPNAMGPIIVNATLAMATMIIVESGLSFLGFGIPQPTPTWGNMITDATSPRIIQNHPNIWLPPAIAIFMTVLAINFIGDGLRDALDPRSRK